MQSATWPLVVYSASSWSAADPRLQQTLTELAHRRRVFVVEEPVPTSDALGLHVSFPAPNVVRCVPTGVLGDDPRGNDALALLLTRLVTTSGRDPHHVAWIASPMALRLARRLAPAAIVHDLEELAVARGAVHVADPWVSPTASASGSAALRQ
jgi:hypothetical protein